MCCSNLARLGYFPGTQVRLKAPTSHNVIVRSGVRFKQPVMSRGHQEVDHNGILITAHGISVGRAQFHSIRAPSYASGQDDCAARRPRRRARLEFGLRFNAVRRRTRRTSQARWSSLNRSGSMRPELLIQYTGRKFGAKSQPRRMACDPRAIADGEPRSRTGSYGHLIGRSWSPKFDSAARSTVARHNVMPKTSERP